MFGVGTVVGTEVGEANANACVGGAAGAVFVGEDVGVKPDEVGRSPLLSAGVLVASED